MNRTIKFWKNKSGKFNYRIKPKGETLTDQNQGFNRMAGLRKNISAIATFFNNPLTWDSEGMNAHDGAGNTISLVEVKAPKK